MKRIRPLELAALLGALTILGFPQSSASELKADTIRILNRSTGSGEQSEAAEPAVDEVPH